MSKNTNKIYKVTLKNTIKIKHCYLKWFPMFRNFGLFRTTEKEAVSRAPAGFYNSFQDNK